MIGTEVPVFEPVATAAVCSFLELFLGRSVSAGQALLTTRQTLLTKEYDPFGLAYTLHDPAELAISAAGASPGAGDEAAAGSVTAEDLRSHAGPGETAA